MLKLPFLCFSGVATASDLFFQHKQWFAIMLVFHGFWYLFSLVFISWWKDYPCSSIMLLSFQKNSLRDYEENEP